MKKYQIITSISILTVAFMMPLAAYANLANGLIGYWTLDTRDYMSATSLIDRSGFGDSATFVATPTKTLGKFGEALKLNGTSQAVSIASTTAFAFGSTTSFSLSIWYNYTGPAMTLGHDNSLMGNINAGGTKGMAWGFEGAGNCAAGSSIGIILLSSAGAGIGACTAVNASFITSGWHNAVVTYNGSKLGSGIVFYVDGTLIVNSTTKSTATTDTAGTGLMRLGDDNTADWFTGSLDDARVYNRVLSKAEANQIWRAGAEIHQGSFSLLGNMLGGMGL